MTSWPLVGRSLQLDRLVSALTGQRPGSLVVAGPAGAGKSRLLAEARSRAERAGTRVHWAIATAAAAGIPLGPFAHLLPPGTQARDPAAMLAAVAAGLRRPGNAVIVDDVHLLDRASVALLDLLLANTCVPVVMALRVSEPAPAIDRVLRDRERLELPALTAAQIAEAVSGALDGPVEPPLLATLARLSQGNPLLLRELVEAALATGILRHRDGVWRSTGPLVVAATLPATIAGRLDRLTPRVRSAAELVAFAEPIEAETLEALVAREVIAAVEAEGLLAELPGHRIGLVHPLYAEALRAATPPMRARAHRRQLAQAVAAQGLDDPRDLVRVAVWCLDAGVKAEPSLLIDAARMAAEAFDHDLAHRIAAAAVEAGGGLPAQLVLLPQLPFQGRAEEALCRAEQLDAVSRDQHDRGHIALVRSHLQLVLGRLKDARSTLSEAIERTEDPQLRLRLLTQQANQAYNTGHMGDAVELGDRLDDPLSRSRVRALACAGRTADAIACAERTIGSLSQGASGDSVLPSLVRMTLLQGLALHGRIDDALDLGNAGLAEAGSSPLLVAFWAHELGHVSLWAGRPRSAARWLRETLALAPVEGLPAGHQLWSLDGLAEAYALLGDAAGAAAQIARLESVLPQGFVAPKRSGAVWAAAAAGELSRACGLARRYGEGLAEAGALLMAGWVWHEAARLGAASTVDSDIALMAQRSQSPLLHALARSATAHSHADPSALDAVAGQFAAMGCPIFAAEAAAEAGRIHRLQGRAGSATAAATRAVAYLAGCEPAHTPLLAARPTGEPLTRRESEVAGLAARGSSDHDIARLLQLSVRTVHSHLYRAYRKLGITDRGELRTALGIPERPRA